MSDPSQGVNTPRQWVRIRDFRPGIFATTTPSNPIGSAQPNDTYRCRAHSSGALIPAPTVTDTVPPPLAVNDYTLVSEAYRITGIACMDPIFEVGNTQWGVDQRNTDIFMGVEWFDDDTHYRAIYRFLRHRLDPNWSSVASTTTDADFDPNTRPKRCYFATGRSNSDDSGQVGPAVIAWAFGGWARMFPNDTATTSTGTASLPGDRYPETGDPENPLVLPDLLITHQGRALLFPLSVSAVGSVGGSAIVYVTNESFYWTEVNDFTTLGTSLVGFFNVLAGYENPTGYSAVASLSAGELLLVKARGGALFIRGSLDDFQAVTVPNLRSAGQSLDLGTASPIGFLYPVDAAGVEVWEGGDTSRPVANQLADDFFRPDPQSDEAWGHTWTQSAVWGDLVMFGNNWFLDTSTRTEATPDGGWWRIDTVEEKVIHYWSVDWKGRHAYAAPRRFSEGTDATLWEYDAKTPAISYIWTSQPIRPDDLLDKSFRTEEVVLTASGQGTVMVRLLDATTHERYDERKFALTDPDLAVTYRTMLSVPAVTHVVVQIRSFGDPDAPSSIAPTVHGVDFSYHETMQIPRETQV